MQGRDEQPPSFLLGENGLLPGRASCTPPALPAPPPHLGMSCTTQKCPFLAHQHSSMPKQSRIVLLKKVSHSVMRPGVLLQLRYFSMAEVAKNASFDWLWWHRSIRYISPIHIFGNYVNPPSASISRCTVYSVSLQKRSCNTLAVCQGAVRQALHTCQDVSLPRLTPSFESMQWSWFEGRQYHLLFCSWNMILMSLVASFSLWDNSAALELH